MKLPTLGEMFQSGLHLGHKKGRSTPGAKKYIFTLREGICIINLEKTLEELEKALDFFKKQSQENKVILFVGTKRQIRNAVKKTAENCFMPYVTWRWLGGTLTNFETVQKGLKHIARLEEELKGEHAQTLSKKEKSTLEKEYARFMKSFEGLKNLSRLPDTLFIIDTAKEKIAVREALKMGITTVGICDTDANPDLIDWPIPANDDAQKSVEFMLGLMEKAILEGKEHGKATATVEKKPDKVPKQSKITAQGDRPSNKQGSAAGGKNQKTCPAAKK